MPTFDRLPANAWLAYAYLEARVPFPSPYFESRNALEFVDSGGRANLVRAFGFREGKPDPPAELLVQGQFWRFGESAGGHHFAVDLCRSSMPTQIVVACIEPGETLESTWKALEQAMVGTRARPMFMPGDRLLVPNAFWQVRHTFVELSKGEVISPPGFPAISAVQEIRFRLDKSGVELQSSADLKLLGGGAEDLRLNRPFLLYLKKRGADQPFFVMWVDNAELLQPWTS